MGGFLVKMTKKFEIKKSKVKVTGKENVENIFSHISQE